MECPLTEREIMYVEDLNVRCFKGSGIEMVNPTTRSHSWLILEFKVWSSFMVLLAVQIPSAIQLYVTLIGFFR